MKKLFRSLSMFTITMLIVACSSELDSNVEVSSVKEESVGVEADASFQMEANNLQEKLLGLFATTRSSNSAIYPDYYGGSYVGKDGKLVIMVTDFNQSPNFPELLKSSAVEEKKCKYSYNQLKQLMNHLSSLQAEKIILLYKDIVNNKVVLGLKEGSDILNLELSDEKKDMLDIKEVKDIVLDEIINPGGGIYVAKKDGNKYMSSFGYRARLKSNTSKVGLVMAGHSFTNSIDNKLYFDAAGTKVVGTRLYSEVTGGNIDAAFCELTDKTYSLTGYIEKAKATLTPIIKIPAVKTAVTMAGAMSTAICPGTIIDADAEINSSTKKLSKVILSNYAAKGGDSGGIVYLYDSSTNSRYIVGTHMGRVIYTNGEECSVIIRADLINAKFGLECY